MYKHIYIYVHLNVKIFRYTCMYTDKYRHLRHLRQPKLIHRWITVDATIQKNRMYTCLQKRYVDDANPCVCKRISLLYIHVCIPMCGDKNTQTYAPTCVCTWTYVNLCVCAVVAHTDIEKSWRMDIFVQQFHLHLGKPVKQTLSIYTHANKPTVIYIYKHVYTVCLSGRIKLWTHVHTQTIHFSYTQACTRIHWQVVYVHLEMYMKNIYLYIYVDTHKYIYIYIDDSIDKYLFIYLYK